MLCTLNFQTPVTVQECYKEIPDDGSRDILLY